MMEQSCSPATGWTKDILGKDFERRTVVLPSDSCGPACCTIVRLRQADGERLRRGVLYVHGFSDYFFQADMAREFHKHGYAFYAVDLRRYGRSLLDGQKPFRVRDLRDYFADISAALDQMQRDGVQLIVLLAHSTGGLITSLMMKECPPPQVEGMILNSPFLAWNLPWFLRHVAVPVVSAVGKLLPALPMKQAADPLYAQSLHKKYSGEWDYNRHWKPDILPPVDAAWIRAIHTAQQRLRHLPALQVPVLLLHSDRGVGRHNTLEEHRHADAILNPADISAAGAYLGPQVTDITIPGGVHDLALSSANVRSIFYATIFGWLSAEEM